MKLLAVKKDASYLYIVTDEGTRQQSLRWKGVRELEDKCRALVGQEITHTTSGTWSPDKWFQDVSPVISKKETIDIGLPFPTDLKFDKQTSLRIFGPPGTGKTDTLIREVIKAIEEGVSPSHIGYLAFTNVAADEAIERILEVNGDEGVEGFQGFSTLHSLATKIGGAEGGEVTTADHLNKFDPLITIRDEWMIAGEAKVAKRPDHPILNAYSYLLNTLKGDLDGGENCISKREGDKSLPLLSKYFGLDEDVIFRSFYDYANRYWQAYLSYKKKNNLVDFNDVILNVVKDSFPDCRIPSFELLIVDEAQDLSNLQWQFVEKLRSKAKKTIVAGDDDQAILAGFGASPERFREFKTTDNDLTLNESHRLPKKIKQYVDDFVEANQDGFKGHKVKKWTSNPKAKTEGEVEYQKPTKVIKNGKEVEEMVWLTTWDLINVLKKDYENDWLVMAPTKATGTMLSDSLSNLNVPHYIHRKSCLDPGDPKKCIKIQTVHTSKGMGAKNVAYVLQSRGDWYMSQDVKLTYVAITRAKERLLMIREKLF